MSLLRSEHDTPSSFLRSERDAPSSFLSICHSYGVSMTRRRPFYRYVTPEFTRPRILLRVDVDLHAGLVVSRGGAGSGRTSGRSSPAQVSDLGRIHSLQTRF